MKHELKNSDERFIWVDKTRKVGRQKIPPQYLEREAMIKSFAAYQADQMKEANDTGFDHSEPVLAARTFQEAPKNMTLSSFVSKDSMPYTSQLKRLADMSTQQVYREIPIHPNNNRGVPYDDIGFKKLRIGMKHS